MKVRGVVLVMPKSKRGDSERVGGMQGGLTEKLLKQRMQLDEQLPSLIYLIGCAGVTRIVPWSRPVARSVKSEWKFRGYKVT